MTKQPFRVRYGVDADNNKIINVADPVGNLDAVNLRTLRSDAGIHLVARVGNLPSPSDPDPLKHPIEGRAYLVKLDLNGQPMDRIAVWDSSQAATGGVATVDVVEPAADAAAITAVAGTADAGKPFTAGAGTGAIIDLTANADGSITGAVTTAGTGYAIGDSMTVPAASLAWPGMTGDTIVTVTGLVGASPTGGWRFVDPQVWVKSLVTNPDPPSGALIGDLAVTSQSGSEQLKVWTGSTWHTLFDAQTIKGWISSLNLFQGTVQENGGTVVGTLQIGALPDITNAATGAQHNSQYWVWTGQAGYVVQAGDPNGLGADLAGAILQVGDWLQVSSQGAAGAKTYHWSQIGGDLLAKSRADVLYGLNAWVAGNYEQGALVNYQGAIYRASAAVTPTDPAPDQAGAPWTMVPLTAGVKNVPADINLPATAPPSDVYLVLNSTQAGGKPALFSYDVAAAAWIQLGGSTGSGIALTGGQMMISVGCPVGTVVAWVAPVLPAGWLLCDGSSINATAYPELRALFPGGNLPDFRGAFLRGAGLNGNGTWGDAARVPGSSQEGSTALPTRGFGTTNSGNHTHHYYSGYGDHSGIKGSDWYSGEMGYRYKDNTTHANQGAHTHNVTGGDPETRPKNFAVNWIIKAVDNSARLRPVTP